MRRWISIFLVSLFMFGPLAAALGAGGASRLPRCCRRRPAHCAMSAQMASMPVESASGDAPILTAPAHCPCFPGYRAASTAPVHAVAVSPASLPVLPAQAHSLAVSRAPAPLSQIRTRAGRGPPAIHLA